MSKIDPSQLEEEKLAHALVSRGLLTRKEYKQFRKDPDYADRDGTPEGMLRHLVKAGLLTESQALRITSDLVDIMNQHIPGYQLLEKLGKGSMGTVFKALQLSMNRLVAVKVLKPKLAVNEDFLDRFYREAQL